MRRVPNPSESLRAVGEDPEAYISAVPAVARRITTERYVLGLSPSPLQSMTSRVRTTEAELDATIAEVRAHLRHNAFRGNVWTVGPSARPAGLVALLRERGFVPATRAPYEPKLTIMALVERPPAPAASTGVE